MAIHKGSGNLNDLEPGKIWNPAYVSAVKNGYDYVDPSEDGPLYSPNGGSYERPLDSFENTHVQDDGYWDMDSSGGSSWSSGGSGSGGNPYEDAIAAQKKALEEAQKNQIAGINQSIDEQARQAYINSMMQQRDLNQNLAASGLSGGMSETTKANLMNTYQNNLNSLEQQRNNLVNQVNANTTGEFANIESQLADYIAQREAADRAYNQWQQEFEYQKAQDALARQDALAAAAAKGNGGTDTPWYKEKVGPTGQTIGSYANRVSKAFNDAKNRGNYTAAAIEELDRIENEGVSAADLNRIIAKTPGLAEAIESYNRIYGY